MNFDNYKIIPNYKTNATDLFLADKEEILACEKTLNIAFDEDYKQYVLKYGCGILGGTYVRIYLPETIILTSAEWKSRINEYWFWDDGKDVLTKEEVLNSVRIGDTFDGDEIILYKQEYFILPRNSEVIYKAGNTLEETITWLCSSGILTEAFAEREFEPFDPGDLGNES
ncbi:SUKH superfamily protein [Flavobacterium araucananum]|uniref:SMI1/KNR4 family protein n=1 Tax=Flavobacterium araucananum TaxID=946678 RepID=A0A227PHP5_9FLAO|nr:SMI1/KNR4 family protein [Flavobacterium araucananum]OXG09399.1 SMI1/KNR4 family protein [Flavobacterium araucananum]PWK02777.1 SUKH superfamily protein [Flavobacterium araucananum]